MSELISTNTRIYFPSNDHSYKYGYLYRERAVYNIYGDYYSEWFEGLELSENEQVVEVWVVR